MSRQDRVYQGFASAFGHFLRRRNRDAEAREDLARRVSPQEPPPIDTLPLYEPENRPVIVPVFFGFDRNEQGRFIRIEVEFTLPVYEVEIRAARATPGPDVTRDNSFLLYPARYMPPILGPWGCRIHPGAPGHEDGPYTIKVFVKTSTGWTTSD